MTKPARTALCVLAALGLSYGVSPTISVTSPSGGQLFDADQPIKIAWNADAGLSMFLVEYSLTGATVWVPITTTAADSCTWVAPFLLNDATAVRVRVTATDVADPPSGLSGAFTIKASGVVDPYEPNNDLASATGIPLDSIITGAVVYSGYYDTFSDTLNGRYIDEDFFTFVVPKAGILTIQMLPEYSQEANGFNPERKAPFFWMTDSVQQWGGGCENGLFLYNALAGPFNIRVYCGGNATWCKYGIRVTLIPATASATSTFQSDAVTKSSDSTYSVRVSANTTRVAVDVTLNRQIGGSVSTAVIDPAALPAVAKSDGNFRTFSVDADPTVKLALTSADIILGYDERDLDTEMQEQSITAKWFNDSLGEWVPVDFTIDTAENTVSIRTTHLSLYGLFTTAAAEVVSPVESPEAPRTHCSFNNGRLLIRAAGFIPTKGTGLIRLYSAAGRLMLERVISKPDAYGNFTGSVDCDNLAGGMYLAVFSYGRYQANSAVMILR